MANFHCSDKPCFFLTGALLPDGFLATGLLLLTGVFDTGFADDFTARGFSISVSSLAVTGFFFIGGTL